MRVHRINAVIVRHLYLFPRTLERWSESIYWPVLDLVVWGLTSRWVESAGPDVPHLALLILTGVVFWQVVWRANYEISVNLLEEFWNQNLVNLFATPLSVWEWSVGLVVLGLLKNVITLLVGAGAVWLLYKLNIFAVGWLILPFLFSLLISGWFMGFAASGVIIYYGRRLQSIAWMAGFALAPFSAVYYPVDVLPRWAQIIASGPAHDLRLRGHAQSPSRRPHADRRSADKLWPEHPLSLAHDPLLRLDVRAQPRSGVGKVGLNLVDQDAWCASLRLISPPITMGVCLPFEGCKHPSARCAARCSCL